MSTKIKVELSFPDNIFTLSTSGTSKHRQWFTYACQCLEIKSKVTGSFSANINYLPLAAALLPAGANATKIEDALTGLQYATP